MPHTHAPPPSRPQGPLTLSCQAQIALSAIHETAAPDPVEIIDFPRQVRHVLRTAAETRQTILLSGPDLPQPLIAHLQLPGPTPSFTALHVEAESAQDFRDGAAVNLVFDRLGARALASAVVIDSSRAESRVVLALTVPKWILVGQTRRHLRVVVPRQRDARLRVAFADGDRLEAQVLDLSEGGLGLLLPHRPLRGIRVGEIWPVARLSTGSGSVLSLDLGVRHVGGSTAGQRIGVRIERAPAADLQRLRRMVLSLQAGGASAPTFSMR